MELAPQGPVRLAEDFYLLGHPAVPVFLLDGPEPVIFEAGFACLAQAYLAAARQVLGSRQPAWLLLSHAHFDHCGAAGWFQRAWPGMRTAAAPKAAKILARPNAIKLIGQLNQAAAQALSGMGQGLAGDDAFLPFTLERTLDDGQELALRGGREVRVLATPGHTWDSLSFHIPALKILVASEAVGTESPGGYIVSEFLVSYAAYAESMRRLAALEVELLCQGHHAVHRSAEARGFFAKSMAAAEQFKDWVLRLLAQEGGGVARVVELVRAGEYDHRPQPKQPLPAYLLNLEARVACLAREFGGPA
jgi:glyoxylase-like metal-dependent hydrolase (beta-lactamase superfamily II)